MEPLIASLRSYARDRLLASRGQIRANLAARGVSAESPLVLDIALPGAAYFSVAAGGLAEVLHLLADDHVLVDRFIGASGGACSLFLILANQGGTSKENLRCPSSELLLREYLKYGESEGSNMLSRSVNAFCQVFAGVSVFWEQRYRELLREEAAFEAIRSRAFVAVAAKPLRRQALAMKARNARSFEASTDNYVFHDFECREQAVQAMVATGEATLKGFLKGINVVGATAEGASSSERRDFALIAGQGELDSPAATTATTATTTAATTTTATAEVVRGEQLQIPSTFCDGGRPVAFQLLPRCCPPTVTGGATLVSQQLDGSCRASQDKTQNQLLYYVTWFSESPSDAAFCSPESIERLFKKGVDRTIHCLCSSSFCSDGASTPEMIIIAPGESLSEALSKIGRHGDLASGAFVSLRDRKVFEL
ncbi:unnamed protein product [Polarella glacialis]|uniref:Uncharacterized protein n=1 Tax=Polarella glacialis TaxID=89957 RepID=A0A813EXF7_POLGL|nr:unnamed protein product [Polarella glacialis]